MRKSVPLILFILPLLLINCDGVGGGVGRDGGPTADNLAVSVDEDFSIPITVTASHPENSDLTWRVVIFPSNGSLAGTDCTATLPDCTYTPGPDYNGPDSFSFTVSDGYQESNVAKVDITVDPVNDKPTGTSASITTFKGTSVGVTPTVDDVDLPGDSFTFSILTQPSSGTASILANQLFYTPNPGITGSDSFTYRAYDSGNLYVDGTASVTILSVSDLPVANNQSVTADEDVALPITLTASYSGGGGLIWTIISQPSHGTLSGTPPNVSYLSTLNYNGPDSFAFQVNDGSQNSNIATVDITVNPVNDAPTSTSASITTDEDTPSAGITPTVIDVDSGESFTFSIITQPASGIASVLTGQLYYTPNPDFFGSDSFTYRAFDSGNLHVDGTASVTIGAVNDPPVADSQSVIADEDIAKPILLTASDVDGDELTYTIVSEPSYGTLTGTPPDVTYLSDEGYFGPDSFSFMVNDGSVDSATANVWLTVNPIPDIWFVDMDAVGTADGRSWSNAFNHPQDALEMAGNGDEIWVADGVYVQRAAADG
jgi:hypothetical protein